MTMRSNTLTIFHEFEKNKVKCTFNTVAQCGERLVDSRSFLEPVSCSSSGFCPLTIETIEKHHHEKYQFATNERPQMGKQQMALSIA